MNKSKERVEICTKSNQFTPFNVGEYLPNSMLVSHSIGECGAEPIQLTNKIIELENLKVKPIVELTGDHLKDAKKIIELTFKNKLIKLDSKIYYFNGKESEIVIDGTARRHIATAMEGGMIKVTKSRVDCTLSVLKDQLIDKGRPNPPDFNVYFSDTVFNLMVGDTEQHKVENKNTRTLSVRYSKNAECPNFISWLNSIFSNELERVDYVQELIGWILCRNNLGIEKAIMLLGPPRAGKGVLLKVMRALLGRGTASFYLRNLGEDKYLSAMRDAHLAIDSDAVGPNKFDANTVMGLFKVITSNEPVAIKLIYIQDPKDGSLNCKLCVAANSAPLMHDDSSAAANRWLPLVFDKCFLEKEDTGLFKRFEKELAGIANWALLGLQRLEKRGAFVLPSSSLEQIALLTSDSGYLNNFLLDELTIDKTLRCTEKNIWDRYVQWAKREGNPLEQRQLIMKSVEDALRGSGVRRAKSIKMSDGKSQRGFYGLEPKRNSSQGNVANLNLPKTG